MKFYYSHLGSEDGLAEEQVVDNDQLERSLDEDVRPAEQVEYEEGEWRVIFFMTTLIGYAHIKLSL